MFCETSKYREKVDSLLKRRQNLIEQDRVETLNLFEEKKLVEDTKAAQGILQAISQSIQQQVHKQIAGVVTTCLETVFGEGYGFQISFEQKRGKTEAVLALVKNGRIETNPLKEDSGGMVEIAALALRIVSLCLNKPKVRKIMILDEPFKSVHSPVYRKNVGKMLEQLAADFKVQIIMVTGIEEYKIGKVIELI